MTIEKDVDLKHLTTLGVGGKTAFFARITNLEELTDAIKFAQNKILPILILGGGSNVVIPTKGYSGLTLQIHNDQYTTTKTDLKLEVGAGVLLSTLVSDSINRGWQGLEWAAGLPGTIGGAVRGNAGAFGQEIKEIVQEILAIDLKTNKTKKFNNQDCLFSYRTSFFKQNSNWLIWQIKLKFNSGNYHELKETAEKNINYRKTHHPQISSAGSFFQNLLVKNLPKDFFNKFPQFKEKVRGSKLGAGALLESLNAKGWLVGDAMVSHKHANFIVNLGSATSEDVCALADKMKQTVKDKYGIKLNEEPVIINNNGILKSNQIPVSSDQINPSVQIPNYQED